MRTKEAQVKARELSAVEYYSQLTGPEVCRLFGVSRTTLWKWVREGRIPEPRYIEAREPRWRLGELVPLLEKLPRMKDAPRGFKATSSDDPAPTPKPTKKGRNVWERLGLAQPK